LVYFPFSSKIHSRCILVSSRTLSEICEIHQEYIMNTLEYIKIHLNTPKYSMCSRGSRDLVSCICCILMYSDVFTHVFCSIKYACIQSVFRVYSGCILSVFWMYSHTFSQGCWAGHRRDTVVICVEYSVYTRNTVGIQCLHYGILR
jgi:hypothetical protein